MDDQRIGAGLRSLRLRAKLRQADLALAAGVPRRVVMLIEAGRLDRVRFGDIRAAAKALGARFDGSILWQGAGLDRMLNRGHARLHEATTAWLRSIGGWVAVPEVSFSFQGERGVIDIVAWHAATRTMLLIELKTRIVDISDLMMTMDVRLRMAPRIARDRRWDPASIGVWVVVAPGRTNARVLAEYATVLRAKFPQDGRAVPGWLARPRGPLAALSFLPQVRLGDLGRDATTLRRVRRPHASVDRGAESRRRTREPRVGVAFRD